MVVAADSYEEKDDLDVVEDVNPFLSFRTLTTDIKHAVSQIAQLEDGFCDSGSAQPRAEDVLVRGEVVLSKEALDIGEEAARGISNGCGIGGGSSALAKVVV